MSELKATTAQEIVRNEKDCDYMDGLFGGVKMPPTQVYLKSEVDKVIAEKDKEIAELKDKLRHYPILVAIVEDSIREIEQDKRKIRHAKYKRCLAMVRWCRYWAGYWETCEPSDCSMFIVKARYYRKWRKRWLELAEKFKEVK